MNGREASFSAKQARQESNLQPRPIPDSHGRCASVPPPPIRPLDVGEARERPSLAASSVGSEIHHGIVETATGVSWSTVVPLPSCPLEFAPQQYAVLGVGAFAMAQV